MEPTAILPHPHAILKAGPEAPSDPPSSPPPVMAYRIGPLAAALGVSRRWLERELAAGRFPAPDRTFGRLRLWSVPTVQAWLARD